MRTARHARTRPRARPRDGGSPDHGDRGQQSATGIGAADGVGDAAPTAPWRSADGAVGDADEPPAPGPAAPLAPAARGAAGRPAIGGTFPVERHRGAHARRLACVRVRLTIAPAHRSEEARAHFGARLARAARGVAGAGRRVAELPGAAGGRAARRRHRTEERAAIARRTARVLAARRRRRTRGRRASRSRVGTGSRVRGGPGIGLDRSVLADERPARRARRPLQPTPGRGGGARDAHHPGVRRHPGVDRGVPAAATRHAQERSCHAREPGTTNRRERHPGSLIETAFEVNPR